MRDFPIFLFFQILHPHSPYTPPSDIARLFHVPQSALASSNQKLVEVDANRVILPEKERQQLITLYDAEIRHLDRLFGRFIESLKKFGIYDQAVIIFLSDHGEGFQEHGRLGHGTTLYQNMVHVPFIIKLPKWYKAQGIRVAENVQTMDVMPTLLNLSQTPIPDFVRGKSLLPCMTRNASKTMIHRLVFSEEHSRKMLCVIKDDFKYLYAGPDAKEELYNLRVDPQETQDLSSKRLDMIESFRNERFLFFKSALEWRKKYSISDQGEKIGLDADQTEQLRALGYVR